ncbi:MAG TPA: CocE/NonD family hydrolase [Candidatus Polarisedimenticolaceae bacterium]|nr:CocE/NonD family hydrolase [Candidatus Polarisedimenticolaceae bacterium]
MGNRSLRCRLVAAGLVSASLVGGAARAGWASWDDEDRRRWLEHHAKVEKRLWVPMRDGVRLSTDLYLPADADGPFPVIFWRTPYNFSELDGMLLSFAHESVARGYAFVLQNERGKFFSEGEWVLLGLPRTDGYDALSWIAEQPWSNGKVGTLGCSSPAEWQLALAAMDHPAHAAMVPMAPGAGIGRVGEFWEQGNWYRGGAEQMFYLPWLYEVQDTQRPRLPDGLSREDLVRLSSYYDLAPEMPEIDWKKKIRILPVADVMERVDGPRGIYKEYFARRPDDPAWFDSGLWHDDEDFAVPSLWLFSWYDISTTPNLALVDHIVRNAGDAEVRDSQFVIMAPVEHCAFFRSASPYTIGERELGDIDLDYEERIYAWFDRWLKGEDNGVTRSMPKVEYWTFGVNEWRKAERWPPAGAETIPFYLASDGDANSLFGDGRLEREPPAENRPDRFTYDPTVPVPSLGGGVCCIGGTIEPGAFDQRAIEARADVLVYTSRPLERDLDATGPVRVTLFVSSDAPDTDFTVKLVDVAPDGTAYNLDETIQRVRYRAGYDREVLMKPGEVYELAVSPMSTSNVFLAGHRIRIEVSSSNFPRFARNLNTGGPNHNESEPAVARNVVHHSKRYPSRIELTVLP